MKAKGGRPELPKEVDRARIFEILRRERTISRPKLGELTGLSRATIMLLVERLLQAGIVREAGFGVSSGGRPPVLLQFQPDSVSAIGARMRDYQWSVLLTDLDAVPQDREEVEIGGGSTEAAVAAITHAIDRLLSRNEWRRILPGIGVGSPGLVDMRNGVIKSAIDVGWFEVPLRDMIQSRVNLEVYLANRSKVGALGERWSGAGAGTQDLIYISIGTGVAAGIILGGELYIGTNSSAGEIGHSTVLPDGPFCPCGNRGCLQQLVSDPALATLARRRLRESQTGKLYEQYGSRPEALDASAVFSAAEAGDQVAVALLEETAEHLAVAVGNLINLFNPEMIVLGGHFGTAGDLFADMLRRKTRTRAMAYPLSAVTITNGTLGADAAAIGAAVLVLQHAPDLLFGRNSEQTT